MKAINIAWPIQKGNSGFFNQTFDTLSAVKSKIYILFNTMEKERPFNPNFGIGLQQYVFQQLTDDLYNELENKITDKLNKYVPEIKIVSIDINNYLNEYTDQNKLSIRLSFKLKTNPTVTETININ